MKNLFPLLALICFLLGCKGDDEVVEPTVDEFTIDIVTGIQARDFNANPVGSYGNPNTFSGEVDVFPNPAIDQVNVLYFGGNNLEVKQFWIVAGDKNTDFSNANFQNLLTNETYSADEVSELNAAITDKVNLSSFAINLEDLTTGYYRIFYLMNDETLLWDNIYVDPSATDYGALVSEVSGDW